MVSTWDMPENFDPAWTMSNSPAPDTTAGAASVLDQGGGLWASAQGTLGQLLDAYTQIEVAKVRGTQLPQSGMPGNSLNMPRTGAGRPGAGGGMSMSTMLLIGGGLLLAVLLLKKA